jgi:hypothetical protein
LSHETVLATFSSYGEVSLARQGELMQALRAPPRQEAAALDQIEQVLRSMRRAPEFAR